MRRRILLAALVAAAMSQSCSRHTSESARSTATLQRSATREISIADSLRVSRDYVLLIDSPSLRIVLPDSTCPQTVTLAGRRAVLASHTEAHADRLSKVVAKDRLAADTAQTLTKSHESRRTSWWRPFIVFVAAVVTLRLSLRGTGSRR